jgi:hypothetical protein
MNLSLLTGWQLQTIQEFMKQFRHHAIILSALLPCLAPDLIMGKDDGDNRMPLAGAVKLDSEAMKLFPGTPPMAPVLHPKGLAIKDKAIAVKLKGLKRDSRIRLPDGKTIPYWQTLQYANRHFRLYITRFREDSTATKKFGKISHAERVRVWGMSARLRKMLCHPDFRKWTGRSKFRKPHTPSNVYARFENVHRGSYIRIRNLKGKAMAVATGKGVTFNSARNFLQKPFDGMIGTYAHEVSHNMGYSHADGVPYPIGDFIKAASRRKLWNYRMYDLAKTPNFEVIPAGR